MAMRLSPDAIIESIERGIHSLRNHSARTSRSATVQSRRVFLGFDTPREPSTVRGYATLRPRPMLLEVLASIARYQHRMHEAGRSAKNIRWGREGAWTIVHQAVILAWYERVMKRLGWSAKVCG